ncbi:MAG: aldo/keto reductase [Rhodospirillaceae bacterium]|nr:aldo/keto reductase [Rhodospirillaceae bacterium]
MERIELGRTGLRVSPVALGCMSFGNRDWRDWVLDEADSLRLLARAHDAGVNFFDTANVYSGGLSERVLGRFVRGLRREDVVVATKCYYPTPDSPHAAGLSRANILYSVDASLRRLGLDDVDILQVHRWDDATPVAETVQALADVVKAGKARVAGASNMRAWQLASAQLAARAISCSGFATLQHHYNLLYREDERDLIPLARDQGIGLMCWSPLARGRLGRAGLAAATTRAASDDVADTLYGAADDPILAALAQVAAARGVPPARIALAWIMGRGIVPVVGATTAGHIDDAVAAAGLALSAAEIAVLERPYTPRALSELPHNARNQAPLEQLAVKLAGRV